LGQNYEAFIPISQAAAVARHEVIMQSKAWHLIWLLFGHETVGQHKHDAERGARLG
jgi:hypothetical protein